MCGIAGVRRFGDAPITHEEIISLLCSIEHRGRDATGVALQGNDGHIEVFKAPIPAWNFVRSDEFKAWIDEQLAKEPIIALLHTRAATTGNPENNENNHPIHWGDTAIVHNGMINNHAFIFNSGSYERKCETDSDIIRAIVDKHGFDEKGLRELCKLSGSAAIACISQKTPGRLLLARSGSPLVCGCSSKDDGKMYWASEAKCIIGSVTPMIKRNGVFFREPGVKISVTSMPDNTAWLFGEKDLELHHQFNTCVHYTAPDYSGNRESYHGKKKRWTREKKQEASRERVLVELREDGWQKGAPRGSIMLCPSKKCGIQIVNTQGVPWEWLVCPDCETPLGATTGD